MSALSYAAGGASDALFDVLKQKLMEQQVRDQQERAMRAFDLQARGQDITAAGQRDARERFDLTRGDALSAAQAEAEQQAAAQAERQAVVGRLRAVSPQMARLVDARSLGFNINDPHGVETDEEHAPHQQAARDAEMADFRTKERFRTDESIRQSKATAPPTNPQQTQGQTYVDERTTRIQQSVDELDRLIGPWTTGAGGLLANMPATDARNFRAKLDTLKANISFGELAEMRAASKTGGALGQVSERELELLGSTLGALDQLQDGAQLKAELQKVRDSLARWDDAKRQYAGGGQAPSVQLGGGSEFDYVPGKGMVPRGSR